MTMNKKRLIVAGVLAAITIAGGCTKNGSTGPAGATGPAGPSYTGAISGHVSLYDQYGSKVSTGLNSVQLVVNGTNTITPDVNGYYAFSSTTGDYYMTASDNGYGATRANSFQYLADTLNKDIKLSAIPGFSPTTVTAYTATGSAPGDSLVINFTADTRARNCIVFVNNTTAVSNLPANYQLVYTKAIAANQTRAVILIPSQDLTDVGITSGSTIYCAAYGYVVGDVSVYEDLTTGKNVYNAVSASPVTATAVAP